MDEAQNTQREAMSMEQQADMQTKCEEYLAGWKRAQADYLNVKKEIEKERLEWTKFANERLLASLLPAIEQFDMAMRFTPEMIQADAWYKGLQAVRSNWQTVFTDIGLEEISTEGLFDPMIHEAIGEEVSEGKESGMILRIVQSGWRLHGKVLRPAKVILTK